MHFRDKIVLGLGALLAIGGCFSTFVWGVETGVIFLLILGLLLVGLSVLQRRQLARVQQRTLDLLRVQQAVEVPTGLGSSGVAELSKELTTAQNKSQQDLATSTTKVLGLLQAQHIALDLLSDKLERISNETPSERGEASPTFSGTDPE